MMRYIDGFDYIPIGSGSLLARSSWYPVIANYWPSLFAGRFGGNCIRYSGNPNGSGCPSIYHPVGSSMLSGVIGTAVYMGSDCSFPFSIYLYDSTDSTTTNKYAIYSLRFNPNGSLSLYSGFFGTLIAQSQPGVFDRDVWFYVDWKFNIDATNGTTTIRVNTQVIFTFTAYNNTIAGVTFDSVLVGSTANSNGDMDYRFDDFYVLDLTGSECNDFLGNVRVGIQDTASNGDTIQFSIGGSSPAATNWQSVQDKALDEAQYVYSSTPGNRDLYHVTASAVTTSIYAVQTRIAARQDDAGQKILQAGIKSGGVLSTSSTLHYLNATETYYTDIWQNDPATAAAWIASAVNLLQVGPYVNQ